MARLKIDEADLLMAFEGSEMMSWYLDRETGDVIGLSDWESLEEEEEIRERIDADEDGRYLPIESLSSHEGFRIMEDFVDSLPDGKARTALSHAIERRRPFRSFKDELTRFPDVREQWFRHQEEREREYALDWLRAEGIEAELVNKYAAGSG